MHLIYYNFIKMSIIKTLKNIFFRHSLNSRKNKIRFYIFLFTCKKTITTASSKNSLECLQCLTSNLFSMDYKQQSLGTYTLHRKSSRKCLTSSCRRNKKTLVILITKFFEIFYKTPLHLIRFNFLGNNFLSNSLNLITSEFFSILIFYFRVRLRFLP